MFMSKSDIGPLTGHPQVAAAAPSRRWWKIGALVMRPLAHQAILCRIDRGSRVNNGTMSGRSRTSPCANALECSGTGRKLIVRIPSNRAAMDAGAHIPWKTISGFRTRNAASWPSMKDLAISSEPKNSGQSQPRSCATETPFTRGCAGIMLNPALVIWYSKREPHDKKPIFRFRLEGHCSRNAVAMAIARVVSPASCQATLNTMWHELSIDATRLTLKDSLQWRFRKELSTIFRDTTCSQILSCLPKSHTFDSSLAV
jgi:hypothetical protein